MTSLNHSSPDTDPIPSDRNTLRRLLRRRRRSLDPRQQKQAARHLARTLTRQPELLRARRIAVYLPNDGEIDPGVFVQAARRRGVSFYLPVLHPILKGRLTFQPWSGSTHLRTNRFGIAEPTFRGHRRHPAWALDTVLLPLVGFDESGGRLGMGGGFYDRTFAFIRHRPRPAPRLIGLAHECQKVDSLPIASWDIPLDAVATARRIYRNV